MERIGHRPAVHEADRGAQLASDVREQSGPFGARRSSSAARRQSSGLLSSVEWVMVIGSVISGSFHLCNAPRAPFVR